MQTLPRRMVEEESEQPAVNPTPILVATDGMPQSEGALAVARSLAARLGAATEVLAVQPPIAHVVPDPTLLIEPGVHARLALDLAERVRDQCARISDGSVGPLGDVEVATGEPARVISERAVEHGAALVVVGLGRHELLDRIFGHETALKVTRLSTVPVLAVPASMREAPRHAVVGVDFSDSSLEAAQRATRLLPPGGTVHLVYVVPRERILLESWLATHDPNTATRHRFARFIARLALPPNVKVAKAVRHGDVARELLRFAEETKSDLIVAGSHGHNFVTRLLVGSVTTSLLRAADRAVLVVPPNAMGANDGLRMLTTHIDRAQWTEVLSDFARVNAGRRAQLEIDDPEIGAQAQEREYPLQGVSFDPHDERVTIMLGRAGVRGPHLSRNIGDVDSVDLLTDRDGKDVALRLHHGAGQTVLTFPP